MARPTDSRIIYLQQLGRALSSDISRDKTIVFDLVNNYLKNNLDIEINRRTNKTRNVEDDYIDIDDGDEITDIEDIDIFRIQGETKKFLELLEEVQGIIGHNEHLVNARNIKKWMEERETTKPPAISSSDYNEKRLGIALSNIRQKLIKPYMILQTEEERNEYREKHPELDGVLSIISELDVQCGNKKQRELAILISQDSEKRKILQEAKKLEHNYEQQLLMKKGQEIENAFEQGVDFDE